MLKAALRPIINRVVTRVRFDNSWLYSAYLSVFRRESAQLRHKEFQFFESVVGRDRPLIFDIGASFGHRARIFRYLAKKVVCVEPTPTAVEFLRRQFLYEPRISIVAKGVGDTESSCEFHMFSEGGCYNTVSKKLVDAMRNAPPGSHLPHLTTAQSITIEMTTLDKLIGQFGKPYYVKIDVEGNEAAVIRGLSEAIPLISFECNLPDFADESEQCIERLSRLTTDAKFQYVIFEPPIAFAAKQWLSRTGMIDIVRYGGLTYMEIFCRST